MSAVDQIMPWFPIVMTLNLPMPTPANRLWRSGKGRVYISPEYKKWKLNADKHFLTQKHMQFRKINGPFEAHLYLNHEKARGDADGRIKAILDYAQARELIADDKFAQKVTVEWCSASMAPAGCLLVLTELG